MPYLVVAGITMNPAYGGAAIGIFVLLGVGGCYQFAAAMGAVDVAGKQCPAQGVPRNGTLLHIGGRTGFEQLLGPGKGSVVDDL